MCVGSPTMFFFLFFHIVPTFLLYTNIFRAQPYFISDVRPRPLQKRIHYHCSPGKSQALVHVTFNRNIQTGSPLGHSLKQVYTGTKTTKEKQQSGATRANLLRRQRLMLILLEDPQARARLQPERRQNRGISRGPWKKSVSKGGLNKYQVTLTGMSMSEINYYRQFHP